MRHPKKLPRPDQVTKIENHDASLADKIEIRERVLAAVGGRVFDAYAGGGTMYAAVWRKAEGYEGCDERRFVDERVMFCADCRRVMRNVDLSPFSIFDFDSFGSPWEPCIILAARRKVAPGERVGIVLTEGSGLKLKFGQLPGALSYLAGMKDRQAGLIRGGKEIAARALAALARRMNCRIEKTWRAERLAGSAMLYFGVVLVGINDAAERAAGLDSRPGGTAASRV